ncbi:MAG: glycosyltransferase family 4 protein [Bacteroidales bacterium]|nr:glycosyltransferase family 4 protein [Bacteroidales bacterium]
MNIAINTRFLIKDKLEGIGWFTYETVKRLCENHPEHTFILFFDRKYHEEFVFSKNVVPVIMYPPARHPLLWRIWFHYNLPKILIKYKAEALISTDGFIPLKLHIPTLNVIHDINFEHIPHALKRSVKNYYKKFFPKYAKQATRIATVSEFSKQDIVKTYSIDASNIDVVYNGANITYTPISEEEKTVTKQKYTQGKDYFIFIGSLHPRKNIPRLLQAFDNFKASDDSEMQLLIVGEAMFLTDEIKTTYETLAFKKDVQFTGRVSTEDLHKILGSAFTMTFVPYFEGFGIPILEAMFCDIPVISSNVTSMPEVGGDAVLYVDPFSVSDITKAMTKIANDKELRDTLIAKGRIQREKFSWDKTAELLWNSFQQCLKK